MAPEIGLEGLTGERPSVPPRWPRFNPRMLAWGNVSPGSPNRAIIHSGPIDFVVAGDSGDGDGGVGPDGIG